MRSFRNLFVIFVIVTPLLIFYTKKLYNKKENSVIIGFAGDVMLGRLVNEKIDQTSYAYPWGNVLPLLKQTDLNIINLETTLTNATEKVQKTFNFKATPDKIKTLQEAHIDVVSLANNHILDFGQEGLFETITTLNSIGIKHVGAGKNKATAQQPVIIEKNGIKIGIIGFTDNEPAWQAHENKPGTNYFKVGDIQVIKKVVDTIRDKVDVVVATLHWGPNMRERPTQAFKDFAHAMIDTGIDIIHGHSAHVFQGIEIYKNRLIMYDTGDLVDDYMVDQNLRNNRSFFYQVETNKTGVKQVKLIPVIISNMQVNLATGKEKVAILEHMRNLSAELGTQVSEKGIIVIQ